MRIGVFSDVHDHIHNVEKTLDRLNKEGIDTAIFCGDFCSPIPARVMGASRMNIHAVFGNTDDRPKITKFADKEFPNMIVYQDSDESKIVIAERKIAFYHFPWPADGLAKSGDYDAVFYGHTHEAKNEKRGDCLFVNPGEVMGMKGFPSCAIYDSDSNTAEIVSLDSVPRK